MAKQKNIDKKAFKKIHNFCPICGQNCYSALQVHRWKVQGKDGGSYKNGNVISVCANCHAKLHANIYTITGVFQSTSGSKVVIYFDNQTKQQHIKPI